MANMLAEIIAIGLMMVGALVSISVGLWVASVLIFIPTSDKFWNRLSTLHDLVVLRHYIRELASQGKLWSLKPENVEDGE